MFQLELYMTNRFVFTLLALFISTSLWGQSEIIPTPKTYFSSKRKAETFQKILVNPTQHTTHELELLDLWGKQLGIQVTTDLSAPSTLPFHFVKKAADPSKLDAYQMQFDGDIVYILYTTEASKIYAISSILQLIQPTSTGFELIPFKLEDEAKFKWRGLHLDVCRHFFSIDEVKKYIDLMAFYKFNNFHWHLTDDQGWRIEIKKYPLLTEIGGYRDSTLNDHYSTIPRTWNTERYGGYYTQEQIKNVVQYAQVRGVNIVPEIELPGHSRAALAAYPQLSCTGKYNNVTGLWGVFDDIFCSKDETIQFLQDVLEEVIALFPSKIIHIGGDEAPKTRWKACPKCQENIRKHNLKDEHELQSWFIQQMDQFLTKRGRKLIGWDEILEGGLSPNAAVMSWRGEQGGLEAAGQQHEVVMSPGSHCYFDHYQGDSREEPIAFGGYTPLEKVYDFNPIPNGLAPENQIYILGAQANLWTEYILNYKHLEYMVYPRALALIQNLWGANKPDYESFKNILLNKQLAILKAKDVNYSLSFLRPKFKTVKTSTGINVTLSPENSTFSKVEYLVKGSTSVKEITGNHLSFDRENNRPLSTARVYGTEPVFHSESSVDISLHQGLGAKVTLLTEPNKNYAHNGAFALVDGVRGQRPWKGHEWLGFNTGDVEILVEPDPKMKSNELIVSLLSANSSWIYLPEEIIVSGSSNGKKWKTINHVICEDELTNIPLSKSYKQLKIKIVPMKIIPEGQFGAGYQPYTFIDELIFNNNQHK